METKKKSSIANILIQVAKNLSDINEKLGKIKDAYLQEKTELSRNIGALWNSFNEDKKRLTVLEENVRMSSETLNQIERILYGEKAIGFAGIIGKMGDFENSLKNLVEEIKESNIKRDTTIKILTTMCTILTSGGFIAFITFIYKLITK